MGLYVLRRLLLLIPTLLGMSVLIFLMLRLLPGDIVDIIAWADAQADSASRAKLRDAMGLSDPLPVQYVKWLADLLRRCLPVTLELAILAVIIATAVSVPLGVISAVKRETRFDFASRVLGL